MPNNDYILRSDALNAMYDWFDQDGSYGDIELEDAIAAIPAADVEPKQRWIPVTERLPEVEEGYTDCESFEEDKDGEFYPVGVFTNWESEPMLVFGNFDCHTGRYLARYTEWRYTDGRPKVCEWVAVDVDEGLSFVTHWMPIPEPPKGEENARENA